MIRTQERPSIPPEKAADLVHRVKRVLEKYERGNQNAETAG